MEWRTAFVGREAEIAAVRSLLARTRLLTLTGPGGIGKTRLAVEAVGALRPESPGELITVELASLRDPEELLPAISAGIGFRDSGAVEPLHVLSERLGRVETLLLLDNFEQIASAGPQVGALLDATPSLRVVVTSRIPLRISGEQEYPVPPLDLPAEGTTATPDDVGSAEAVRLFVERARSVRPDFELTGQNAAQIAAICRQLDGLPLAIELAASRLRVLSPDAILKRLGQRLALLTGGAADAPARQRALRATIAWSYELLPERERALLARCAVFAGGFSLDGAAAVAPAATEEAGLLDELGLLVDHNLLTASTGSDGEPRFGMLETIREFALGELTASEGADVRDHHATYCLQLAEVAESQLQGREHARWLTRLNDEIDNVRVALAWLHESRDAERFSRLAAAMGIYWRYYGNIREGRRWLGDALDVSSEANPGSHAAVLMTAGWLEAVGGELARGKDLLERALALYEEIGDDARVARTLYHLGSTLTDMDDRDAAVGLLQRGLALARAGRDDAVEGRLLYALSLSMTMYDEGRIAEREELIRQSIDASMRAGDMQRVGLSLNYYGWTAWDAGNESLAIERWTDSIRVLREWGERAFLASILLVASFGLVSTGRLEASRASLLEGLRLTREAGAVPDIIASLAHATYWLHTIGAEERARATWRATERFLSQHGMEVHVAWPLALVRDQMSGQARNSAASPAGSVSRTLEQALDVAERDVEMTPVSPATSPASQSHALARSRFDLTPREQEVLELVAVGRSNAEIGAALFISRKTASVHVANIKEKLGADSRIEIVTKALEDGLVSSGSVTAREE